MSQEKEILKYMQAGKPITAIDALREFGCFRLAARIKDLRDSGHPVMTSTVKSGTKKFAQYTL